MRTPDLRQVITFNPYADIRRIEALEWMRPQYGSLEQDSPLNG